MKQISLPSRTLTDQIFTACVLECSAPKPGNVHPGASFADVCYTDFIRSAEVSAPILARSAETGVGHAIRDAVIATHEAVGTNTNLGMLLLLGPLAAIPIGTRCKEGIGGILSALDLQQTKEIYEAIRLAHPGGLGESAKHDISREPEVSIVEAMRLAPHDRVAWQYTHYFEDVLSFGRERFLHWSQQGVDWSTSLILTQLEFLARQSDSLILRKCGEAVANEVQSRACSVLAAWDSPQQIPAELATFDAWLRADGHRRNPGTTADLLAAMLFALIRDGQWSPPQQIEPVEVNVLN